LPVACELNSLRILPADYVFWGLNTLAGYSPDAAELIAPGRQTDPGMAWFMEIDAVLRSKPDAAAVLSISRKTKRLMDSSSWDYFVEAVVMDARSASSIRAERRCLRSLWGVTPIITLKETVAADRYIGIDAENLVFSTYHVTSAFDINLSGHVEAVLQQEPGLQDAFYWTVLLWALIAYDIFFLFNDRGILAPVEFTGYLTMGINLEELGLLRRAEKYLYTLAYGADFRTKERAMAQQPFNFCMDCETIGQNCLCNDETWPLIFHPIAAYATAMLGTSLALREVPGIRRFDFNVIDTATFKPVYTAIEPEHKLRVLHVPNHPFFKGTRYLQAAMARFEAEGARIEFKLASGVTNSEVLDLMRWCDVLVDQLIGGFFGRTALEGMAFGKPVIVYLVDPELVVAPQECPLINANPDTIYQVLNGLVQAPHQLNQIGLRSRQYVDNYYSVPALAERLRDLYRETAGIVL
jgi:glycosyltransferase involved in cell wall biosynthesis